VLDAAIAVLPPEAAPLVEVKAAPGLPAIWADHDRLEQVFVNLLANAFKHNPPGTSVSVSARALSRTEQPEVEITVTDDGIGFPSALAASPFEASQRHRSRSSGAGLGLSIANGIVLAHDGWLELAPAVVGTSFRILLPVEAPPGHTAEGSEVTAPGPAYAMTAAPGRDLAAGAPAPGGPR